MSATAVWYVPLTPEQIRLVIDSLAEHTGEEGVDELIEFLEEFLAAELEVT